MPARRARGFAQTADQRVVGAVSFMGWFRRDGGRGLGRRLAVTLGGSPGILTRRGRTCTSDAWRLAAPPSLGIFIITRERDVGVATLILSEALDVIALGTRSLLASS
jgi:hypothetical protein